MKRKSKTSAAVKKATGRTRSSAPSSEKSSPPKTSRRKKGEDLFAQIVRLTGIPAKTIQDELKTILERKNIDVNHLTLEQLRVVAASYLREIMGGLLDRYGHKRPESSH